LPLGQWVIGDEVVEDGRGTLGNLLEVVAQLEEDGTWWSTVTRAEEDDTTVKSVA
jgi:hypothetical protein